MKTLIKIGTCSVSCHLSAEVCANNHNSPLEGLSGLVQQCTCDKFLPLQINQLSSPPFSPQIKRQAFKVHSVFTLLSSTIIYYRQSIVSCMHNYRLLVNNPSQLSACTELCFLTPIMRIYTLYNPLPVYLTQTLMYHFFASLHINSHSIILSTKRT